MRITLATLAIGILVLSGCQNNDPYARFQLGNARNAVAASVEYSGGVKAWRQADDITATALITSTGEDGVVNVDRVQLKMDFHDRSITASGKSPRGAWTITQRRHWGTDAEGPVPMAVRENLGTILHCSMGALNLLHGEKVVSAASRRIQGVAVTRVEAKNRDGEKLYYDIDQATSQLRFISVPGDGGTVTIYTADDPYLKLGNGLKLAREFRIFEAGEYTPVGEKMILEVQFTEAVAEK